jgi:hypothetical protein
VYKLFEEAKKAFGQLYKCMSEEIERVLQEVEPSVAGGLHIRGSSAVEAASGAVEPMLEFFGQNRYDYPVISAIMRTWRNPVYAHA